jgi:hypothetical protein
MEEAPHLKYKAEELPALVAFANGLPEKARRHFLALQYKHLGEGSQRYLAEIFNCSRITITNGLRELAESDESTFDYNRQRQEGGGRKKREDRDESDG